MKVAVTYENGEVFPHFGRTPQFKIYKYVARKPIRCSRLWDESRYGKLP